MSDSATTDASASTTPPPNTERRLATIEVVSEIAPIPEADAIVRARIRGWDIVVKLDEFKPGDPCVYFEVDTMLDVEDSRFEFLAPRGVRTDVYDRKGHVLKTVRLRGQYSQGLALPLSEFPELGAFEVDRAGEDVTDILGVFKWEPPVPAELAGQVRGNRPGWIPKTDEERVQNFADVLAVTDQTWVATEKVDGSSVTFWVNGDDEGVCSRNLDLIETPTNTLWRLARDRNVFALLRASGLGERCAIQGEAYGEGIQKNPLKMRGHHFAAFTVLSEHGDLARSAWPEWALALSVPTHDLVFPTSLEKALEQVDGMKSAISPDRAAEGVVWRSLDNTTIEMPDGRFERASFKVISNRYLLKHDN